MMSFARVVDIAIINGTMLLLFADRLICSICSLVWRLKVYHFMCASHDRYASSWMFCQVFIKNNKAGTGLTNSVSSLFLMIVHKMIATLTVNNISIISIQIYMTIRPKIVQCYISIYHYFILNHNYYFIKWM